MEATSSARIEQERLYMEHFASLRSLSRADKTKPEPQNREAMEKRFLVSAKSK
jgi:hypothetical protein